MNNVRIGVQNVYVPTSHEETKVEEPKNEIVFEDKVNLAKLLLDAKRDFGNGPVKLKLPKQVTAGQVRKMRRLQRREETNTTVTPES